MKLEILDWIFLGSAALCAVALFVSPFPASAVEIGAGAESQIDDYLDTAGENLQSIDFQLDSDQDGNRSVRLKIFGLQQFALTQQSNFYDSLDFSAAPDTATFSGGGGVAFYRRTQNGDPIPCTISACMPGEVLASSEDFNLTIRFDTAQMNAAAESYFSSTSAGFRYTGNTIWTYINYIDSSGYFSNYRHDQNIFNNSTYVVGWSTNYIPVMSSGTRADLVYFGLGESLTLPPGTIDTSRPWDYYNNVLLPYMEEEFPGYDEFFVFPDGYYPQEPTEPITIPFLEPTSPNWDIIGDDIGTNPPGADDAVYDVSDPDQLSLPLPDPGFDKIQFSLSSFGDSIAFWFAFLGRVCDSLHITPVLTIALCLGAVGFILWKVGS